MSGLEEKLIYCFKLPADMVRGSIREFAHYTDGPAFLKRKPTPTQYHYCQSEIACQLFLQSRWFSGINICKNPSHFPSTHYQHPLSSNCIVNESQCADWKRSFSSSIAVSRHVSGRCHSFLSYVATTLSCWYLFLKDFILILSFSLYPGCTRSLFPIGLHAKFWKHS